LAGRCVAAEEKCLQVRATFRRLEQGLAPAECTELLAAIYAATDRRASAMDALRVARDFHFRLGLGDACARLDLKLGRLMLRDSATDRSARVRDVLTLWIPALVFLDHRREQSRIGEHRPASDTWAENYLSCTFALIEEAADPPFVTALLESASNQDQYPSSGG